MKKLAVYYTEHETSHELLKRLCKGINENKTNWEAELCNIEDFFNNGIMPNVNGVLVHGILRGTGLVIQEAIKKNIDYYYIDHAYFNSGYQGQFWNRISKNSLSINYLKRIDDLRWNFFKKNFDLKPWKKSNQRGEKILVIPPTSAIQWFYDVKDWYKKLIIFLAQNFDDDLVKRIKVRYKPNEPIVDDLGNLLGIKETKKEFDIPLQEDLENSCLVIAFNSNVALEATRKGIPVIVDHTNACSPLSYFITDITKNLDNPKFDIEPDRIGLLKWLSYCQFNIEEVENGSAWNMVINQQN